MCEMVWEIVGIYRGMSKTSEVIDHADNEETADYLVGEYRLAFGAGWQVYKRRVAT